MWNNWQGGGNSFPVINTEVGLYRFGNKNPNLLYNSDFSLGTKYWNVNNLTPNILSDFIYGTYIKFQTTQVSIWANRIYSLNLLGSLGKGFVSSKTYTVSFYAKADTEGACINVYPSTSTNSIALSTEWKRYSLVCRGTGSLTIAPLLANVNYSITKIKVEEGTKLTKWCKTKEV